jgi:hypothetical protein
MIVALRPIAEKLIKFLQPHAMRMHNAPNAMRRLKKVGDALRTDGNKQEVERKKSKSLKTLC